MDRIYQTSFLVFVTSDTMDAELISGPRIFKIKVEINTKNLKNLKKK